MVSESLITKIVNDTLDKEAPRASWDHPNTMALTFGLKLSVPPNLDGHRTLEVVVFRPMTYTQVWSRLLSTTIPLVDLEDEDGEGPKPGKDWTTSTGEWRLHADHDSCWREGLAEALKQHEGEIVLFSGPFDWYEMIEAASLNLPDPATAREQQYTAKRS